MNERFDDIIRRRLQGLESDVPAGLFDDIKNRTEVKDAFFDDTIRQKTALAESPVPADTFIAINAAIDMLHLGPDSIILGKLEDYTSHVPADMWQRITIKNDRHRRPIAWWWMAATILLLLSSAGGLFMLKNSVQTHQQQATIYPDAKRKQLATPPDEKEKKKGDELSDSNAHQVETGNINAEKNADANGQNKLIKLKTSNGNSVAQFSDNSHSTNNLRAGVKSVFAQQIPTKEQGIELPTDGLYEQHWEINQTTDRAAAHLSILGLLRNGSQFTPGQLLQAKTRNLPVIPCPINGDDKRSDWYVELYGSAFLLQKAIQDKEINKQAKAGFDSTLHRQVSLNAGIRLVKKIGSRFLVKTGLQYNRINESFKLTQVNERRLVTTISVRTVIISPGDTVRIRDTSTTEQIGTALHRTQNRYTQWDIPLIFGYEFGNENLRLNANAGIIANIRSSYQGEMVADSTRQIFDINNYKGKPVYQKNVGFSLYAGLSILKPLSERMNLLLEPHARIGIRNVANNQAWFSQTNSTMGLSIGIRYKLNSSRQRIY